MSALPTLAISCTVMDSKLHSEETHKVVFFVFHVRLRFMLSWGDKQFPIEPSLIQWSMYLVPQSCTFHWLC